MNDVKLPSRFDYGEEALKTTRDQGIKDSYFKETKDFSYNKNRILIGWSPKTGQPYYLDVAEAFRMMFLGRTRTGKSFNVQSLITRMFKSGYDIAFIPDAKDEFKHMDAPIQKKFRVKGEGPVETGLHPEEKPTAMPVEAYRPLFFKKKVDRNSSPKDNQYVSVDLADISKKDLQTLLRYNDMTTAQKDVFELIWAEMEERDINGIEEVDQIVEEMEDLTSVQKRAMQRKFEPLKNARFFHSSYTKNPVMDIKKAKIPILNMKKFDNFGDEGSGMPQTFISIWLRKIINARRDREIDEVVVVVDETARWIPASGDPSCKEEFMESVDLDTAEGINYIFSTQRPGSVPNDLISQMRYIAIPWNADMNDLKMVLKKSGLVRNVQTAFNTASNIKDRMEKYEWLIIDQNTNSYDRVKFLAPLSFHMESSH